MLDLLYAHSMWFPGLSYIPVMTVTKIELLIPQVASAFLECCMLKVALLAKKMVCTHKKR